jgi:hypothetical protein
VNVTRAFLTGCAGLIVVGCSAPAITPSPPSDAPPAPPQLSAFQERASATIEGFLEAYNGGQVEAASALLTEGGDITDCDFRQGRTVVVRGKEAVSAWLRERVADHDRIVLAGLALGRDGTETLALTYERRTSDTLQALGFPDGIQPGVAQVVVNKNGDRLAAFATGPYGGPQDTCRPGTR